MSTRHTLENNEPINVALSVSFDFASTLEADWGVQWLRLCRGPWSGSSKHEFEPRLIERDQTEQVRPLAAVEAHVSN